ncbi:MAG: hypothetical protein ACI4QT_10050 [Kiritimatiellia bacterium]
MFARRPKSDVRSAFPSRLGLLLSVVLSVLLQGRVYANAVRQDRFVLDIPTPEGYSTAPELYKLSFLVVRSLLDEKAGNAFEVFVDSDSIENGLPPKCSLTLSLCSQDISYCTANHRVFEKVRESLKQAYREMERLPMLRRSSTVPDVPEGECRRYCFVDREECAGWVCVHRVFNKKQNKSMLMASAQIYVLVDTQIFLLELRIQEPTYGDLREAVELLEDYAPQLHLLSGGSKGVREKELEEENLMRLQEELTNHLFL